MLTYLPFLGDGSHLRTILLSPLQRDLFTSSFPELFVLAETTRLGMKAAQSAGRNGALALLLVVTLYEAWRVQWRWLDMVRASFNVLLFFLLFLCLWFQPWYVTWIVPLASLLPSRRVTTVTVIFCFSALAKYLVYDFFWFLRPGMDTQQIETLSVSVIYIAPLAYLAVSALAERLPIKRRVDAGKMEETASG